MKTSFRRFVVRSVAAYSQAAAHPGAELGVAVPCGSCTACCRTFEVVATEEDLAREPGLAITGEWITQEGGARATKLRHAPGGECAHFVGGRCAVYATRPTACRMFDCRISALFRLSSLPPDGFPPEPFEELNRASFERCAKDIEPPASKAQELALRAALSAREPGVDVGAMSLQCLIVAAAGLARGGDVGAQHAVQGFLEAAQKLVGPTAANEPEYST